MGEFDEISYSKAIKNEQDLADITQQVGAIKAIGTPNGEYATLAALSAAHPTDDGNTYIVTANEHVYKWVSGAWTDTGITWQATLPADGSITDAMMSATGIKAKVTDATIDRRAELKLSYYKNLLNPNVVSSNTLLGDTGATSVSSGWSTSDYIPVSPSTQISIKQARRVAEYDIYKRFITNTYVDVNPQAQKTFTVSANTYFVRFSCSNTSLATNQLELGATSTAFVAYKAPVIKHRDGSALSVDSVVSVGLPYSIKRGSKNIYNKSTSLADTILSDTTGATSASAGWITSDYIEVTPNTQITINRARRVAEYDADKLLVAGTIQDSATQAKTTFTTNANTAYIRISISNLLEPALQAEYNSEPTFYENYYYSVFYNNTKIFDLIGGENSAMSNLLQSTDYTKYADRSKYQIWQYTSTSGKKIMALHKDVAVRASGVAIGSTIEISITGINGAYSNSVVFNSTNFPNLMANSEIEYILLLPWSRNPVTSREGMQWRMVLITSFGQVYHNYPSRTPEANKIDGTEVAGDITKFDESVIWDLPERKYPSTNSAASGVERYYPGLPAECYNYHPKLNTDGGFVDTYGNGGFGKSITQMVDSVEVTFPRFYQPGRTWQTNSISPMGGYEPDDKISLIGTYKSNLAEAVRICIFATDDGGRTWYNKYEFADDSGVYTNPINTSALATAYVANSYSLSKRTLVVPTEEVKEPATKFTWGADVVISDITRASVAVATTSGAHNLTTGAVIAIKQNSSCANWDWMINGTISTTSGGNGLLFKVKVLTPTTFELYEYVASAFNNIPCRHIHFVNKLKDGWLFGTGETYPHGFIFYMQMKEADSFATKLAYQTFPIVRLTSSANAVQRLLGATMFDDKDATMLVAVDNELTARDNITMPSGRTETFSRSSTGIFKGKLADIDDMDLFTCIFEAKQVAYYFKEKGNVFIYIGQQGEFAMSFDKGANWETEDLGKLAQHFFGESKKFIVIDDFIIIIK